MFRPPALLASALLCVLLVSISGSAEALASPVRGVPVLTDNSLYRSGKIKSSECPDGALSTQNAADAKRTLVGLWSCLNASWSAHFKRAKLPFASAKLVVLTKPARFCGQKWKKGVNARHCYATRTSAILVGEDYYLRTRVIYHFQYVAGMYGRHLQSLTGITNGHVALSYKSQAERLEQARRGILQADCLGGVFLGSVWKSAGQDSEGWPALLELVKKNGDYNSRKDRRSARGKNIVYWLDRGFRSGDPGSCKTWAVPSSRVA
ncbi:hypothetical protein [Streptosporangium sp. NBC_01469]|uniref:hypothetical protein n=1 Tax=Streptosporangium sp. NBC_01469 TaxID=2903898 RepID=UPI002E2CCD0B|nr:hypothetical protein [Streptosporangium sp. NBC_01469]